MRRIHGPFMLLVEWVVANVVAGAAFGLEVTLLARDPTNVFAPVRGNLDFVACGLLFGTAQWLVLRRHVAGVR